MAFYPFPNQKLELGSAGRFVSDLQRELGIAVTGVFDFLTMCKVALHKFENGLNHSDPSVDHETWNSIFNKNNPNHEAQTPENIGGNAGIATVGQVPRTEEAQRQQNNPFTVTPPTPTAAAPTPQATPDPGASLAAAAKAAAPNEDQPRQDMPSITATEQKATGGPAGGFSAAPTDTVNNEPTPGATAAGVTSADEPHTNV